MDIRQPTIFLDLAVAPQGAQVPTPNGLPTNDMVELTLIQKALYPFLETVAAERSKQVKTITSHIEISLNAIINRAQVQFAELTALKDAGADEQGLEGRLKMVSDKLEELNGRLDARREELQKERECTLGDIHCIGRAWVLPHPERETPAMAPMVRDDEVEKTAIAAASQYEEARGCTVESVEAQNKGFDLVSRKFDEEDPELLREFRYIEVKGRSAVGEVALSTNEYKTAERLKEDYWLYVVYNCATNPEVHVIRNPARLGWKPLVKVEHYQIGPNDLLRASES